ncbi:MAG: trypsin-like peptidase domain-containing protein [Verrucomicrobia bacterium]|nr:trypsin-like peptidase domain-containing protein [Verrucomicrobiota bacterium]
MPKNLRLPLLSAAVLALATPLSPVPAQESRTLNFDPSTEPAVLAIAKVQPAVVNINTERVVRTTVQDPFESMLNEFFGGNLGGGGRTQERKQSSLGSGFVVDPEGYIITNEHVVERAADLKISVSFPDGSTYDAKYVGGDRQFDLALLKIEKRDGKPFPHIDLSKPSPNFLGQTVLALGNPLGYKSSVSRGIISAKDREVRIQDVTYRKLLQTDAAINPGNSGGPLIDLAGQLCGVNSVRMAFTPDRMPVSGIGFSIPASVVAEKFALFRQQARSPVVASNPTVRGGGSDIDINEAFSKIPWSGNLKDGSSRGGSSAAPGGGGSKPPAAAEASASSARRLFGLSLQTLTDDLAAVFGIQTEKGVLISDVDPGSPAREAGLRKGLVLYKIGKYNVTNPAEVEKILSDVKAGTEVDIVAGTPGRRLPFGLGSSPAQKTTVTLTAR